MPLYVFTLLFIKLFGHLPGIIQEYSLWINSYTNNCGIGMKCNIAMARSTEGCTDLKEILIASDYVSPFNGDFFIILFSFFLFG